MGRALVRYMKRKGDHLVLFSRNLDRYKGEAFLAHIPMLPWPPDEKGLADWGDLDAVVNLAGETINQRWTKRAKERILTSRVETTRQVVGLINRGRLRTKTLINASAVGYYGPSPAGPLTEDAPGGPGHDFLATVAQRWEQEADQAALGGVRVVKARLGVVLGPQGGALARMALPYRLYAGGTIGSGTQWVSWVHLEDAVRAIRFLAQEQNLRGPVNLTAPSPVQMKEFGQTMGQVLHRPHWLPVPSFALRLILGEMADLILKGQRAIPAKLLDAGFQFKFPELKSALEDLLIKQRVSGQSG